MTTPRLQASFESAEAFLAAYKVEISQGGLLIRGAQLGGGVGVGPCQVDVEVAGVAPIAVAAQIAASIPGVGVAVMFPDRSALDALAARLVGGEAEPEAEAEGEGPPAPGTMRARLQAMSVLEKMQLALSGDREARTWLLRDLNKTLHVYVLRNPRIGVDEVQYAAKMATLSPEALKTIAEHDEWGHNPAVCAALARNPKTPVPLVLRILPRLPMTELRALAKGTARMPIVQAARKLVNG